MRQAAVGFQCPECVKAGRQGMRVPRTPFGGRLASTGNRVTTVLIAINVAVFVLANVTGGYASPVTARLELIPSANFPALGYVGVAQGSYWQLLTCMFLHVQVLHIALNMIGLWIFGPFVEQVLGRWRFLALYLITGLTGSVAVYVWAPVHSQSLGASGAIFGLFGAALVILLKQRRDVTQLLVLLALNLVITFTVSGISWQAHLGGLVAGLLLGLGFGYLPRPHRGALHGAMFSALGLVLVVVVVIRTGMLTG